MHTNRKGFTLLELVVVIAIILILVVISALIYPKMVDRAKRARVESDFQAIATALESYRSDFGSYPASPSVEFGAPVDAPTPATVITRELSGKDGTKNTNGTVTLLGEAGPVSFIKTETVQQMVNPWQAKHGYHYESDGSNWKLWCYIDNCNALMRTNSSNGCFYTNLCGEGGGDGGNGGDGGDGGGGGFTGTGLPWPMAYHDAQNSNRSQYAGPQGPNVKVKWQYSASYRSYYAPVVDANNNVYRADYYGYLTKLNSNGEIQWQFSLENGWFDGSPALSSDGSTVYLACSWDYFYALNTSDGSIRWRYPTLSVDEDDYTIYPEYECSSPIVGPDGVIYFATDQGDLIALNPNGSLKWKCAISPGAYLYYNAPTLGTDGSIYVCDIDDSVVYAIDTASGDVQWSVDVPDINGPAVLGSNNALYIAAGGDGIYKIDTATHQVVTPPFFYATGYYLVFSPAVGSDGTVYFTASTLGGENTILYAYSANGTEKWSYQLPSEGCTSPVVDSNNVVYVTLDPGIMAIKDTGSQPACLWSTTSAQYGYSYYLVLGSDGTLYIENDTKVLRALVSSDGFFITIHVGQVDFGSVTVDPQKDSYKAGDTVTLTAIPNGDHVFTSWSGDITGTINPITIIVNKDIDVAANFATPGDLVWNTFLGGSSNDEAEDIVKDSSGNIYVIGEGNATWGTPKRSYSGSWDVFVAKLDNNGNLLWNTFLGGGSSDNCCGVVLDSSGNIYVAGASYGSWGTPQHVYSGSSDAFVAKLDNNGNLLWNTFLGSSSSDGCSSIALDSSGNIYVAGTSYATWGTPVRAYSGNADVFIAKLNNSDGDLIWNAFLGGSNIDYNHGIALDSSGNIYVAGTSYATWGTPVRAYSGGYNTFVAKLDSSSNLIWNTFLGGSSSDACCGIVLDSSGNIYVTGYSYGSWGTPQRPYTADRDVFVAKLNNSDGDLIWNTFLGGGSADNCCGIVLDSSGNIYVAGDSTGTWGVPKRPYSGNYDVFVAKLNSSGTLLWNTFLGGSSSDKASGIVLDSSGNIYVAGDSTGTWGVPKRPYTSGEDAFVAKLVGF